MTPIPKPSGRRGIEFLPVSLTTYARLLPEVRRCTYWEVQREGADIVLDDELEKEAWASQVLLQWGSCGRILLRDDQTEGSAMFAPPQFVPRAAAMPAGPVSSDAVLLTTLRVRPQPDAWELLPDLIASVITELGGRGVRAIEAFALRCGNSPPTAEVSPAPARTARETAGPASTAEWHRRIGDPCRIEDCVTALTTLEEHGFQIVRDHPRLPRVRLEIDRDHRWKAGVEAALDQLLLDAQIAALINTSPEKVCEPSGRHRGVGRLPRVRG